MGQDYGYEAVFQTPEPKTQKEARLRPDARDWVQAEIVEMNTLHAKGTIEYVNEGKGEELSKKARACARGDLQSCDEYSETFAPTPRFNALRYLISVAAREDMKLMQSDIKVAFMISKIEDQDIYMSLPDGYSAPAGQVAKLAHSLYRLRDSAFRYH